MLQTLRNCIQNIATTPRRQARHAYARAMAIVVSVGDTFDDLMSEQGRQRFPELINEISFAAQELAYVYKAQHGQRIGPRAIDPEGYDLVLRPRGMARPNIDPARMEREILAFIREHYPDTLPPNLR